MPANGPQRIGPRASLPPAQTGYEIATVVKASPTDPYSPTAAGTSSAGGLMQALGVAADKVIPVSLKAGEVWAGEQKKKGVEARFVGDALDPNQSNAFIDGFERMDGQYRGVQFGNAAKQYALTNSHLDPVEFQAGLDELQKEFVGKLIHQGQMDTFLPDAIKGGEHAVGVYQAAKNAEVLQERNMKTTAISTNLVATSVDSALKEIGIPGGAQQLTENPLLSSTVIANKEKFLSLVGPVLRAHLDDMRENYKTLGMSTPEISANLLGVVGRLAVSTSTPELMSYAFLPDKAGMTVANAFPEKVDAYMAQAASNRKTLTHEALVLQRQQEKESVVAYTNGMIFATAAIPSGDNVAAAAVLASFQSNPLFAKMDPSDTRRMAEDLFNIVQRRGFAKESDPDVYTGLRIRAELKQVAPSEIFANRKLLSFAHYSELLNTVNATTTKAKDEAKDAGMDLYRRELASQDKAIEQMLNPTGPAGNILHPENADVHAKARQSFGRLMEAALKANGGKREDPAILEKIRSAGREVIEANWPLVKSTVKGNSVGFYSKNGVPAVVEHGPVKPSTKLPPMTKSSEYLNLFNPTYK